MVITCLIIEDEPLAQERLKACIKNVSFLKLVGTYDNVFDAQLVIAKQTPDLIFLDVNLPQMSGLEWLRSRDQRSPNVILVTADPFFALEGFDLNVIDYLLKPVKLERFVKAVNRFIDRRQPEQSSGQELPIFIKQGRETIQILPSTIQYLFAEKGYVFIHTSNEVFMTLNTINHFEEELPAPPFYRINRSVIINKSEIYRFNNHHMTLRSGKIFPITPLYIQNLEKISLGT